MAAARRSDRHSVSRGPSTSFKVPSSSGPTSLVERAAPDPSLHGSPLADDACAVADDVRGAMKRSVASIRQLREAWGRLETAGAAPLAVWTMADMEGFEA